MEDGNVNQRMIVLCGLVGSGKSTFAEALIATFPKFVRISQDVLGSRQACEQLTKKSLEEGFSVIIYRQNFDAKQRARWVEMGKTFRGSAPLKIDVIEFDTKKAECAARLEGRATHETLKSVQQAKKVLNYGAKDWVAPHPSEGYDRHLQLYPVPFGKLSEFAPTIPLSAMTLARHPITYPIEPALIISIMDVLESLPAIQSTDILSAPKATHQNSSGSCGSSLGESPGSGQSISVYLPPQRRNLPSVTGESRSL